MKTLAWLGLIGVGAAGIYYYTKEDDAVDSVAPYDPVYAPPPVDEPPPGPSKEIPIPAPDPVDKLVLSDPEIPNVFSRGLGGMRFRSTGRRYR